ncbi:MAG: TraY domain-containing protein [Candidatus Eremiobacteraeota bacterium]|nr:TraY domain-containing protein [Candidatus Eremiobacteraeota bacterium]
MRTTLTLDEDVAAKLEAEARRSGRSFRMVVNETLRLGLLRPPRSPSVPPFKVRPKRLGLRAGLSYDNIEELLDLAEGQSRR